MHLQTETEDIDFGIIQDRNGGDTSSELLDGGIPGGGGFLIQAESWVIAPLGGKGAPGRVARVNGADHQRLASSNPLSIGVMVLLQKLSKRQKNTVGTGAKRPRLTFETLLPVNR